MNTYELLNKIQKLNIVCYNLDFDNFRNILEYSLGYKLDRGYVEEKFEIFKISGLRFLNNLSDGYAERFLEKLLERI